MTFETAETFSYMGICPFCTLDEQLTEDKSSVIPIP